MDVNEWMNVRLRKDHAIEFIALEMSDATKVIEWKTILFSR